MPLSQTGRSDAASAWRARFRRLSHCFAKPSLLVARGGASARRPPRGSSRRSPGSSQQALEVRRGDDQRPDGRCGRDRRASRPVAEQRQLAEEVAGAERRNALSVPHDVGAAFERARRTRAQARPASSAPSPAGDRARRRSLRSFAARPSSSRRRAGSWRTRLLGGLDGAFAAESKPRAAFAHRASPGRSGRCPDPRRGDA